MFKRYGAFSLENNSQPENLAALYAQCDDNAGNHLVWVDREGFVFIDFIHPDLTREEFEKHHRPAVFCKHECLRGCDNVGPNAAQDRGHISWQECALQRAWRSPGDVSLGE